MSGDGGSGGGKGGGDGGGNGGGGTGSGRQVRHRHIGNACAYALVLSWQISQASSAATLTLVRRDLV